MLVSDSDGISEVSPFDNVPLITVAEAFFLSNVCRKRVAPQKMVLGMMEIPPGVKVRSRWK